MDNKKDYEITKGCDDYHAQKDMRSEADASLNEIIDNMGNVFEKFCDAIGKIK